MQQLYIETPLLYSEYYSRLLNKNIYLKLENLQPSGSFKVRGIGKLCSYYMEQGLYNFVSSSGGNAGLAVAYSAKVLKANALIFVPKTTPKITIDQMEALGASVNVVGDSWNEADTHARKAANKKDCGYVSPFDHELIWDGHASIITELKKQCPQKPDVIMCSVGGGGLLKGILTGLAKENWNDVSVCTSETNGANSFYQTYTQKKHVVLESIDTIAKTLGAPYVTKSLLAELNNKNIHPYCVTDAQALESCLGFATNHRMLVEPACGATIALLHNYQDKLIDYENIVVLVCGGVGVELVIDNLKYYIAH